MNEFPLWQCTQQYASGRLLDEFVDLISYRRWKFDTTGDGRTMQHPCAQCKKFGTTIYSINFGAAFCSPGCYRKFDRGFEKWCAREVGYEYEKTNNSMEGVGEAEPEAEEFPNS